MAQKTAKILKKMVIYILMFTVLLALAGFIFLQGPQFGKTPYGERLSRIKKSKNYRDGKFQNLSYTPELKEGSSYWDVLREYFKKHENQAPKDSLPSVKTDLKSLDANENLLIWFGHSSYYMQVDGIKILVDPVFSGAASPVSFFGKGYKGSDVYTAEDMPEIDVMIISHDHYDHLDYTTVKQLQPKIKRVITGLGTGSHLEYWGYDPTKITELDWYEISSLPGCTVTATPARHFSGRGLKRDQTLWSSFVLKTSSQNIYIGGDSGYDIHFKSIGDTYGPFDLAIIECGQYNELWKYIHLMPYDFGKTAKEINTKTLLPVHWGKFTLALHAWNAPIDSLATEMAKIDLPVMTPLIGEKATWTTPKPVNNRWWKD